MFKKVGFFLLIALGIFAFGLFVGLNSWDKNIYISSLSNERGLAGEDDQILNLSSNQLIQDVSNTLFSNHSVKRNPKSLSFTLGNFLIPDEEGGSHVFVCEKYPFVEFSFVASGVRNSGENIYMLVESPCLKNPDNEDEIGPFEIPTETILKEPTKLSFQYTNFLDETISIQFYNGSAYLSNSWYLESVSFLVDKNEREEALIVHRDKEQESHYFQISLEEKKENSPPPKIVN